MANPFHDELGKFCSRDEMQAAIEKLGTAGDLEGYFKLRTELQQIDDNTWPKKLKDGRFVNKHGIIIPWSPEALKVSNDEKGSILTGAKYVENRNVEEVAEELRKDVEEAINVGYLPSAFKYSIETGNPAIPASIKFTTLMVGLKSDDSRLGLSRSMMEGKIRVLSAQHSQTFIPKGGDKQLGSILWLFEVKEDN